MTITEFLLARIAEDEAAANAAQQGSWYMGQNPDYGFDEGIWVETKDVHEIVCIRDAGYETLTNDVLVHGPHVIPLGPSKDWQDGPHIARHDPSRVLAECAAKRAIIKQVSDVAWGGYAVRDVILEHLAGVYVDHPDFRLEWA